MRVTRWRKWSNAASSPMTDWMASGKPRSSVGHVGQPLDLAHHVVAEVADQAAVQRREVGQRGRPVVAERGLDGGEDALVERDGRVDRGAVVDADVAAVGREAWPLAAADERPATPALAVLDGLEQEAGLVAAQPGEGRDRRDRGRPPARARPARRCSRGPARGTRRGWDVPRSPGSPAGRFAEGPEEARVVAGVAGPGTLLLDHEQQGVAVAVVGGPADPLPLARRVALAPLLLPRCGSRTPCGPLRGCGAGWSAFIHAIISTSPVLSSCTMAGTRPSALYVDRVEVGVEDGDRGGGRHGRQSYEAAPAPPKRLALLPCRECSVGTVAMRPLSGLATASTLTARSPGR